MTRPPMVVAFSILKRYWPGGAGDREVWLQEMTRGTKPARDALTLRYQEPARSGIATWAVPRESVVAVTFSPPSYEHSRWASRIAALLEKSRTSIVAAYGCFS